MSGKTRILLTEHNAPLFAEPRMWKVERVVTDKVAESLIESYVAQTEARYKTLSEQLRESGADGATLRKILEAFKDEFVSSLRERGERLRVSGPAQLENRQNGNGRKYPTALWNRVLGEGSDFMRRLQDKQVLGELEHPTEGNTKLPRVSHLVEDVWRKDGVVYARHLIFRTPNGSILEEIYSAGAVPGVSSRGAGSTRQEDGVDVVEADDFHLDTWDFVAQPSVSIARPANVGESQESHQKPPSGKISETVGRIFMPSFVHLSEERGARNMANLTESTEAVVNARTALAQSGAFLENKGGITLAGLLEHQQNMVGLLSSLSGQFPDELKETAAGLRASLGERLNTFRREIKQMAEDDDAPPPFVKKKTDDDDADDTQESEQGDGDVMPGDDEDDQNEGMNKLFGIKKEHLNKISVSDLIEELVRRNNNLRRESQGHVTGTKHQMAVELGEALVERAKSDRKVYEGRIAALEQQVKEATATARATRDILEATITRYRTEQVQAVVEGLVEKNPRLKTIEKKMLECKSTTELRKLVEGVVKPLSEASNRRRPDLPPLTESSGSRTSPAPRQGSKASGSLMGMLTESERS